MNYRKLSLFDRLGLIKGKDVPQSTWYYFTEMEKITNNKYIRTWLYTNKDSSNKIVILNDETFILKTKKTRSLKLVKLLSSKSMKGLIVEREEI